ncbi:hypothetical protein DRO58_09580 [Candidatus Bathyarchaeota archaeon]|nr:MAG: hypothetical protein DRO58_09580 [Candidatus Bathyarchaeota archaeon]
MEAVQVSLKNYERGVEDSLELALEIVQKAKSLREAEQQLLRALAFVKDYKLEQIRNMLGL